MAAKSGILGEGTATGTGAVTLYTVPSAKSARVRLKFAVEAPTATWKYAIRIGTPGSEMTFHENPPSDADIWSGSRRMNTTDPTDSMLGAVGGKSQAAAGLDLDTINSGPEWYNAPYPSDEFLSTGDTVEVEILQSSVTDHLVQVVGVEDDA